MNEWPSDTPAWLLKAFEEMERASRLNLANPTSGVSPERGAGYIQCLEQLRGYVEDALYDEQQKIELAKAAMTEAMQKSRPA